jgi:hypothetical protein
MTNDPRTAGWRNGLLDTPHDADGFADDIVFEASALAKPIKGKALVAALLTAAGSIYESLQFTAETTDNSTIYLQWHATAFGGMALKGVTVLERDVDGRIVGAAVHHRPLEAVLRMSAELRDRLTDMVPADHFIVGNLTHSPDKTS